MHKIVHLTDPHIVSGGQLLFGIDPVQRLREVLAHIAETHHDTKAILTTGDLAHSGTVAEYETLQNLLEEIKLPVHLTLGNHDNRANFREVFGGNGFVQSAVPIGEWHIILLDTKDNFSCKGSLDCGRIDWLEDSLKRAAKSPVLLGIHHPPHTMHMPGLAGIGLKNEKEFLDVVRRHGNVRHMFFGHAHIGVSGSLGGVPFSANRGTSHHVALDLKQSGESAFVAATPAYDVAALDEDSVLIHRHEGFDILPVIRPADPK